MSSESSKIGVLRNTDSDLNSLGGVSTASLANAIETFSIRSRNDGFMGGEIQCRFPEMVPMVGRALTIAVSSPERVDPKANLYWQMWEQLANIPYPSVLVMQNVGGAPDRCAYFGEVMATIARRLGAVGMVTDGGVRDLSAVRDLGFHYFSRYITPSHGNFQIVQVGAPVVIGGQTVSSGDILHGDEDGVIVVPESLLPELKEAVTRFEQQEAELMAYIEAPEFDLDTARQMRQEWE